MIARGVSAPQPSRFRIWYGRDEPPPETRELRAGPLTVVLEGPDLRYVRAGRVEVVRRLYAAIRDHNWGTVPPELTDFRVDEEPDAFTVTFEARHRRQKLDFRWSGRIRGGPDGTLECSLEGVAETAFRYNRIGWCILHPAENAGRPFRARTPEGTIDDRLPDTIGPQLIVEGFPSPIFPSFDDLEIELPEGVRARFELEGDLFEMEDQRNWTDASFKTYSTPLQLGFPHQAEAGQRIEQRVRLSLTGAFDAPPGETGGAARIELGPETGTLLPSLGLGMSSHGGALSRRETEWLRALAPDHLRSDLRLGEDGWEAEHARAVEAAGALGAALELALFLGGRPERELDGLAGRLREAGARVARVLVFRPGEPVTEGRWVALARERLGEALPGVPFVGGTNVLFTDLNRFRPELEPLDAVAYPLNATVHADDDTSVVETMAMHGETVRSARSFCDELPIVIGPVTFNQRFNPVATGPEPEPGPGELPSQVDRRQPSLLGAGWTLGSLKYLAEAGAASVTYFETTGWRGVVETEAGPPVPEAFASAPGTAYPLYHVLADAGEWKGGEVAGARSSEPLAVEALAVRHGGALHVLVANVTAQPQTCELGPVEGARARIRMLDESSHVAATREPQRFRGEVREEGVTGGRLTLELPPFAVARVDVGAR
jgi:D-apionolactonase